MMPLLQPLLSKKGQLSIFSINLFLFIYLEMAHWNVPFNSEVLHVLALHKAGLDRFHFTHG